MKTCKHCNHEIDETGFMDQTLDSMRKLEACFDCFYWFSQASDPPPHALIDDKWGHYIAAPGIKDPTKTAFLGQRGRHYLVTLKSGEQYETNDLWCQGPIPEYHRHMFTPNCKIEQVCQASVRM